MKKFLLIFVSVIVIVIIAFAVLIKVYVTPERVKEIVIPAAEESLNRKINVGEISINLIKGIGLKDFVIKDKDQKSVFMRCEDFFLKFQLLPLLAKKVIIDEMKVVSPEIRIIRNKQREYNFEGIGQQTPSTSNQTETQDAKEGGIPVSLLVNKVAVQNAKFSLTDLIKELPDIKSTLDINMSIESVSSSEIRSSGDIDIKLDQMVMRKPVERYVKNLDASVKYSIGIDLETKDIHIDRADLKVQKIQALINGDVRDLRTSPDIDVEVTLPKAKAAELQEVAAIFTDLKGMNVSGDISADMKLKGKIQKLETLKVNGDILMDKVGVKYQDVNASFDGKINFNEKIMNIDLKSTIDKNSALLKGSVKNYFKDQEINLNIYSKQLFLDRLIPVSKPERVSPDRSASRTSGKTSSEAEPLETKVEARGEIKVDNAVYKGMNMNNFSMKYKFRENKLNIQEMTAEAGRGEMDINSLIDFSVPGYAYALSGNIDSLHAEDIVNSLFPEAKDTVFGTISSKFQLTGKGTQKENIKKNLSGDGEFRIVDGKITDTKISENLSLLLDIEELKTIELNEAYGTVKIMNGIARLDSIFTADDIAMDPSGDIGLDESLDLAFDLKLSPRLTDKAMSSKISQYIKSEEGWGMIPLMVSGTFSKPVYAVDVEKAGKRVIKKEAEKLIDKLFDKKDEEDKKELEPIKDLLKGIFK